MLEGAVMEYMKWFIAILSLLFISILVIYMFKLNEVNVFQQEVNYQIERHGGLTEDAMAALDESARENYGGCLAESMEVDAPCLISTGDDDSSSGFFVKEYTDDGTNKAFRTRLNGQEARYGLEINYVITRQLGQVAVFSGINPAVTGVSSSRVRGVLDN